MNTAPACFVASAPATLMLTGEHAVLYGYPALVCAVNQRMIVTLTSRTDGKIIIRSPRLGELEMRLSTISVQPPFLFITTAILEISKTSSIKTGFTLDIKSDFSHEVGLGSSAAVTVATLKALADWLQLNWSLKDLYEVAYATIQSVQKIGSGADIAACIYGGIILYQRNPWLCQKLEPEFPINLIYSGSKKPTPEVVALVQQLYAEQPELYQSIFAAINTCTLNAVQAIQAKDWQRLGELFNEHQKWQAALGVSNAIIDTIIKNLLLQDSVFGAKISGSGLGDCVIAVGAVPDHLFPLNAEQKKLGIEQLSAQISTQGVRSEQ